MADDAPPQDHVPPEPPPQPNNDSVEANVKSRSTWMRLVFMLVLFVVWGISRIVVGAVVVLQFLFVLFTAKTNDQLTELGQSLATYSYQLVLYLTFNTEQRPFPFDAEWPSGPPHVGTESQ